MLNVNKSAILISTCMVQSFRHPFAKTVTCTFHNPGKVTTSPMPWWGSGLLIIIGIGAWCISSQYSIDGLSEAARLLVYVPLGNIFGMSQQALSRPQVQ